MPFKYRQRTERKFRLMQLKKLAQVKRQEITSKKSDDEAAHNKSMSSIDIDLKDLTDAVTRTRQLILNSRGDRKRQLKREISQENMRYYQSIQDINNRPVKV